MSSAKCTGIRALAKSDVFRKMYWTSLYVCKAIEYIHRRLLGRPTYGRQEINKYFDIAAKQGFYAVVDAIINSVEYSEAFGEDTVPYERYLTPGGVALRQLRVGSIREDVGGKVQKQETPMFVTMGTVTDTRTEPDIQFRINQGVSKQREQTKVFKQVANISDKAAVQTLISAAYRQIFERDVAPYIAKNEFSVLESKLSNGEITVKEFIEGLGYSNLYIKEFYTPYPNTKVIELGTKHFLGRAPVDQAEIRKYNQILATQGIRAFIAALMNSAEYREVFGEAALMNSAEYREVFGEDTVPYRRFPTLPAANFPNTEKLYNQLTKQNDDLVVPSFKTVQPRLTVAASSNGGNSYADLGRSSNNGQGQFGEVRLASKAARIYRLNQGTNQADKELVINAIYSQVLDVYSGEIPANYRLTALDSKLQTGEISVREFVLELASSQIYCDRFYTPYPSAKVIEFLCRHLLGRTPASQEEMSDYNKLLANRGLRAVVEAIVNSAEYTRYFGEDVVPYPRFSS